MIDKNCYYAEMYSSKTHCFIVFILFVGFYEFCINCREHITLTAMIVYSKGKVIPVLN